MAHFFNNALARLDRSSPDSEGSSRHSGLSSPERSASPAPPAPPRPHSNDRDGSSSPEDWSFDDYFIDRPTLPLSSSQLVAIRGDSNFPPPREIPAAIVQDILRLVPTRDWEDEDDLQRRFALVNRYGCDGYDAWLQAIDPSTGNSLVHVIIPSGRVGALGVCNRYPTCGRGAHLGVREQHMLLMHQNHDGDTGLHLAARVGSLPMIQGLLRLVMEGSLDLEAPGEFDRPKNENGEERSDFTRTEMILFIEARNNNGRNAVQEARHYAREENAVFLEYVLDQSYPAGCVDRASVRQESRLYVDVKYMFKTPKDEV